MKVISTIRRRLSFSDLMKIIKDYPKIKAKNDDNKDKITDLDKNVPDDEIVKIVKDKK